MAARSNMPVMREPKARGRRNRRLIVLLVLFFITILLLLFFHSSFSRITSIEIAGYVYVSQEEIMQASGIELGDHFFGVTANRIKQRIEGIEIIEEASVTKRFPGQVSIAVKEYPEVAYQIGESGRPEALLANGTALAIRDRNVIIDKPILTGWEDQEMKSRLTFVLAELPHDLLADISEIKHEPNPVSYPDKIVMYTRSQFQIVTTIEKLPEKIKAYRYIIEYQLEQGVTGGVITMLEADSFRPYPKSQTSGDELVDHEAEQSAE